MTLVVSFSGITGALRQELKKTVACLGGLYAADLSERADYLITATNPDLAAPKIQLCFKLNIPIVEVGWLYACDAAGTWIDATNYQIHFKSHLAADMTSVTAENSPVEHPRYAEAENDENFDFGIYVNTNIAAGGAVRREAVVDSSPPSVGTTQNTAGLHDLLKIVQRLQISDTMSPPGLEDCPLLMTNMFNIGCAICIPSLPGICQKTNPLVQEAVSKRHGRSVAVQTYDNLTLSFPCHERQISFRAMDACRGGVMLYDVVEGRPLHAFVLIKAIYTLQGDPEEVYIVHSYLFSESDILERPEWKQNLRNVDLKEGELLLSAGLYVSPANLLVEAFGLVYRCGNPSKWNPPIPEKPTYPLYLCCKGFNAETGKIASLKNILQQW